jgi:CBS domain containing-hemolysin-like protein
MFMPFLMILILILFSAFFAMAEMSLAASRRTRLQRMVNEGNKQALLVLQVQENPGFYFTTIQIGVNTVSILGGIVGEGVLTPYFVSVLSVVLGEVAAQKLSFALSFFVVTSAFIILADLVPKRLSMNEPERFAVRVIGPMLWLTQSLRPVAWLYSSVSEFLLRLLGQPIKRDEKITHHDILAMTEAGNQAGVVADEEQQVIENVLELDTRTVETSMTARDRVVYICLDDEDALVRSKITETPHSTYLVCEGEIDQVVGYMDATDLFQCVLRGESIAISEQKNLIKKVLMVPNRLTLSEVLVQFRQAHEDFAVIVNEYSLVVGVITLNDVMSTVMGSFVGAHDEEQIVRREDGSFLADGSTPIADIDKALDINEWPLEGQYDTLAGFLMVMLRRIPRRTDQVKWQGWCFEVVDVDRHRVDQVMIQRLHPE